MTRRLGGVLVMALGAVLMSTGVATGSGVTVGEPPPPCAPTEVGVNAPCPTGTITFDETTTTPASPAVAHAVAPHALGPWEVTITSDCALPSGGTSDVVEVPEGGTASSDDLYIWTNANQSESCQYTLTATPVDGYTPSFSPDSPVTLPDAVRGSNTVVTFTNTAKAVVVTTTTTAPVTTTTPAPVTATTSAGATGGTLPETTSIAPSATVVADPGSTLPFTGSRHRIGTLFFLGLALLLGGAVLTLAAGRRRPGSHRS